MAVVLRKFYWKFTCKVRTYGCSMMPYIFLRRFWKSMAPSAFAIYQGNKQLLKLHPSLQENQSAN